MHVTMFVLMVLVVAADAVPANVKENARGNAPHDRYMEDGKQTTDATIKTTKNAFEVRRHRVPQLLADLRALPSAASNNAVKPRIVNVPYNNGHPKIEGQKLKINNNGHPKIEGQKLKINQTGHPIPASMIVKPKTTDNKNGHLKIEGQILKINKTGHPKVKSEKLPNLVFPDLQKVEATNTVLSRPIAIYPLAAGKIKATNGNNGAQPPVKPVTPIGTNGNLVPAHPQVPRKRGPGFDKNGVLPIAHPKANGKTRNNHHDHEILDQNTHRLCPDLNNIRKKLLRAVRNYDARLPCGQGKIFLDGPDAYVLWVKDDEKFLYRFPNEETLAKSLNPNNIYGTSCVDNDHCYDDTSLFLPKVGDQDAGKYRCRVHYQGSSSVDYVIDLQIVEATGMPNLFDERGEKIVTPYVGPLALGSNLTLTCQVVISDPPTTVLWIRNGVTIRRIVSDKPGVLFEKVEIVSATRSELDARYECTASNADVTHAMAVSVVVKMYLPPLKVELRLNNNSNFEVGHPRVVDCVVVGCVPPPTINWYIGGRLLKASVHKELHDGNFTVSSLTLIASLRDNNKWLSCRVHNAYLSTIYEDNVTLHVDYPKLNRRISSTKVIGIVPGEMETLSCISSCNDHPHKFAWVFNCSEKTTLPLKIKDKLFTSTLNWMPSVNDTGNIICYPLTNGGEKIGEPCTYIAVMGGAPEAPHCYEEQDDEIDPLEDVFIICVPGWDGGRNNTISLQVIDADSVVVYQEKNDHGHFRIPRSFSHLPLTAFAESVRGISPEYRFRMNRTETMYENEESPNFPLRVGITAGISVAFVVVLAFLFKMIISLKRRLLRARKSVRKEKTTKKDDIELSEWRFNPEVFAFTKQGREHEEPKFLPLRENGASAGRIVSPPPLRRKSSTSTNDIYYEQPKPRHFVEVKTTRFGPDPDYDAVWTAATGSPTPGSPTPGTSGTRFVGLPELQVWSDGDDASPVSSAASPPPWATPASFCTPSKRVSFVADVQVHNYGDGTSSPSPTEKTPSNN